MATGGTFLRSLPADRQRVEPVRWDVRGPALTLRWGLPPRMLVHRSDHFLGVPVAENWTRTTAFGDSSEPTLAGQGQKRVPQVGTP